MAEEGRVVNVYGLPTDVDHERLRDKLQIHFLRQRNGGGEVTSVTIIGGTRLRALVAFEDRRVVHSVLRHHPHILQLDGVKYELSLSLPNQEPLSLNKVVLGMTVIVDCSQLPQGAETLNVLHSEFPGLHLESDSLQHTCTLQGSYFDFQGAFSYMQSLFTNHLSRADYHTFTGDSGQGPKKKEDLASAKKRNSFVSDPSGTSFYPSLTAGNLRSISTVGFGQEHYRLRDNEMLVERNTQIKKSKMEEGTACRIDEADLEDLSIIMEADVFAYLQTIKEYKRILQHHRVHVVDATSEGVTTLYLQSEDPSGLEVKQNIRQAHKELRQLYQQQEVCLRKDQIQKRAIHMPDGLNTAFKKVQSLVPNVLLSHDQDNIYIIGEKSEVSQAKQLLILGVEDNSIKTLTEMPPSSSSSLSASSESSEREQQVKRKSEVHTSVPPKLIGSSAERKGEVGNAKEYKLAARFKSSGLGHPREEMGGDIRSLTGKMDMLKLASNSPSTPPTRPSFGVLSNELTGEGTEALRMTEPSCSGEDVLFKIQEPLSVNTFGGVTLNTSKAKPIISAGLTSALTTGVKSSENRSVNSLPASNTKIKTDAPSLTSSLRRSNSFSDQPYLREQVQNNQITPEPMIFTHSRQRARSNSISGGRPSEHCPVEAKLTVSFLMWDYMKAVYRSELDVIKSDLQMFEKKTDKGEVSVTLKGTDSSRVAESHRLLQTLVASVASDFYFQELSLTDLGVVEKDKLFETCCMNIRSHYQKINLHIAKKSIFLIGPKQLCSKVSDLFKDVFSGQKSTFQSQMKSLQEDVDHGATHASLQSIKTDHTDQRPEEFSHQDTSKDSYNRKSGSQTDKLDMPTLDGLENPRPLRNELSKTNSISQLADANKPIRPKFDGPSSLPQKKQDSSKTLKQTNLLSRNSSEQCVCGEVGTNVKWTTCGVILCSKCKTLHSYCRVCGKEEVNSQKKVTVQSNSKDTQEQLSGDGDSSEHKGIQGTMTCVEMPVSLAGYHKYTTAKITYFIPDGIQGDKDPCPGSPFEGGQFEAYLPLSPTGRRLLLALEKAFNQGLTFTITLSKKTSGDARVTWGKIPHKTRMEGGKSSNGYPDSHYLDVLSDSLVAHGIEGPTAKIKPNPDLLTNENQ